MLPCLRVNSGYPPHGVLTGNSCRLNCHVTMNQPMNAFDLQGKIAPEAMRTLREPSKIWSPLHYVIVYFLLSRDKRFFFRDMILGA